MEKITKVSFSGVSLGPVEKQASMVEWLFEITYFNDFYHFNPSPRGAQNVRTLADHLGFLPYSDLQTPDFDQVHNPTTS